MKAIFAAIKRSPRLSALVAVMAGAIIVPATLFAWGPDRPTFTIENAANYVTFNSITNNPAYGDERDFVHIKEASQPNSAYTNQVNLEPNKEYDVYVYYHNNAKSSLNASGTGVAKDVKLRMDMPADVKAGTNAAISGYISASNANPGTVYDEAWGKATSDLSLRYVPDSATINNFGATNGQKLPSSLMTTGAALGYDTLNGTVPGCNEYSGYVKFKITTVQPNFEVTKQVSLAGKGNYVESVNVKSGDKVDYRIKYKNTGSVVQNNVNITDTLPAGVTYVPGTTYVSNAVTNNQWDKVDSDEVTKGGINTGSYAPGGAVYVKFTAVVNSDACGDTKITNRANANTENGSKSDTADVVVNKTCAPGEINVCELATKKIVTIKESDFDSSKYSKNFADCQSTPVTPVTELPQTGIDTGVATMAGIGALTAAAAYAVRSPRLRSLLRG